MRSRNKIGAASLTVLTYVIVIGSLLPLVWLLTTALKSRVDAFAMPPKWLFEPTLDNFTAVLEQGTFASAYLNSIITVLGTTAFSLIFGVSAGYVLSSSRSRSGTFMGRWIILARMAPPIGFAIPFFLLFGKLGLLNNYLGLILIYLTITLPFVTWLMVGFFKDLPPELEEAARLDGCSRLHALIRVLTPSVRSGIATCAIFAFIMAWNEFFYALIVSGMDTKPASVEIQGFISSAGVNWGELSAAAFLVVLPALTFTIFAQRGLLRGLTSGSVK